jgi:hypothetical protein
VGPAAGASGAYFSLLGPQMIGIGSSAKSPLNVFYEPFKYIVRAKDHLAFCQPASTFGRFAAAHQLGNGSHTIAVRGYSTITWLP